jgi:DNA-binding cell septation regulator SpoVG
MSDQEFPGQEEGVSRTKAGRPAKYATEAERKAADAARKAGARKPKPTPGFFTPGHVACCQCGECLARRGVAGSNPDLVVTEGKVIQGDGSLAHSAADRKSDDENYWDWYYALHPEEQDHRTMKVETIEAPYGSEEYQAGVLAGHRGKGLPERVVEKAVSLGNDKYRIKPDVLDRTK